MLRASSYIYGRAMLRAYRVQFTASVESRTPHGLLNLWINLPIDFVLQHIVEFSKQAYTLGETSPGSDARTDPTEATHRI